MKPQLAASIGPKYSHFPCYVQPKLNGVRALFQAGVFQSRGEKLWKESFFPHLREQLFQLGPTVILDGELYVHGWKLQRINSAVGVNNNAPNPDTPSIEFHIFDVVDPKRDFTSRWFDYYHPIIAAELPHVHAVPTAYATNHVEVDQHFHHHTSLGYEGIMLRPDGPYVFGETTHGTRKNSPFLWKYKSWVDGEFTCVGITQGEGKADIGIGALVLQRDPNYLKYQHHQFKVGTGFDDAERIALMKNPPIGKLVRIRYLYLTEDGIPFNPSFLAVMS